MHVAVAGNIGAGKTSLTEILAKYYGWKPHFENADENPYLNDFYKDMQRWAYNLQIFFLNSRFHDIMKIQRFGENVIQDRTIYEDAEIFAPNLHDMGLMSTRDFLTYRSLYDMINRLAKAPDLLIYLRASVPTLVSQIQKRGREYESSIRPDYLRQLNNRYEAWISNYQSSKLLIFNVDEMDFISNPEKINNITDSINSEIHELL